MRRTAHRSTTPLFRMMLGSMAVFLLMIVSVPGAEAAGSASLGNDVSWPQCGKALPKSPAFGVVGVNNGLANNTNPCLAEELSWAGTASGTTNQPRVALYVNTANPGAGGSWWPTSNSYAGTTVANPYGQCAPGSVGAACSYMYGWAKAYDDANSRGVANPSAYTWWLDVEASNTWSSDQGANRADLEGMTAYFTSIGAQAGLYSTGSQWSRIAGTVPSSSNLYAVDSWLAGATNLTSAKRLCSAAPLTAGGRVSIAQYRSSFDYDYSCIG